MSMIHWTEEGFGFPLFNGNNEDAVYKFISEHDPNVPSFNQFCMSKKDGDDDVMEELIGEPASWRIAFIINSKEGMTVFKGYRSCSDTEQEEMLGIQTILPWEGNENDRCMTEDGAVKLLGKYAEMLGICEEPDYFEAYYFG